MKMTVLWIDLTNNRKSRSEPCRLFPQWRQQDL